MSRFKPYPQYKDSGVEWLAEVPEHWSLAPLKRQCSCNDEVLPESTSPDYELEYVEISDVDAQRGITGSTSFRFENAPSRARRIVKDGDVLVSTVRTYLRAIAQVSRPAENLIASTGFAVIRPKPNSLDSKYLGYLVRAEWFIAEIIARSTGVSYPAINSSELMQLEVPVPSQSEQLLIGQFLDHEVARIDALIAEQQRLIELLKEKRQAVISHAVTKGLDPTVPMQDSGVEWLGQVPAHWIVTKLGRIAFMQEGPGLRHWQFMDSGVRVICVTNITEKGVDFSRLEKFISVDEYESTYKHFTVQKGDILLSSSGNSWGKVAEYLESEGVILNTSTIRLNETPARLISRDYLRNYLQTVQCREQLNVAMTGSCQPNFGPTHLSQVIAAIPPINEQDEISKYLGAKTGQFSKLIDEAEALMSCLQERRSSLISAAVTGKIDLRHWQAPTTASPPEATHG